MKKADSVQSVKDAKNCCGCGICSAVCPRQVISMEITARTGKTEPVIGDACVDCGVCLQLCPQAETLAAPEGRTGTEGEGLQKPLQSLTLRSTKKGLLQNATSGAFVTTLVQYLLEKECYTTAFLVKEHAYADVVQTSACREVTRLERTQKSRYIQVAHTDEVRYLIAHPEEQVIVVGTPCYLKGLEKVLKRFRLNRENYLLIGLFCDKTMTANVWDYFQTVFAQGKLSEMDFRNKKAGGWPGDVCLYLEDGTEMVLPRKERMDVKEYFMPECCLGCMDKLNPFADISVGDDYIHGKDQLGANTVLVRTERGEQIWEQCKELFEWENVAFEQVLKSQHMDGRQKTMQNNLPQLKKKLALGQSRAYDEIQKELSEKRRKAKNPVRRVLRKLGQIIRSF